MEQYVTFETAQLLEKRGYDDIDLSTWYVQEGNRVELKRFEHYNLDYYRKKGDGVYSCPTQAVVMKWLREEHNIHIELTPICTGESDEDLEWHYGWAVMTTIFTYRWRRHDAEHISYEKACENAIQYCLENILK